MKKRLEMVTLPSDLLELEAYGVTTSADQSRPVMLFRALTGITEKEEILPVWLSPIDAGIAISQHHLKSSTASPHDLTIKVLMGLGVTLDRCVFTDLKGHHQFVDLHFSGSRKLKFISCRADQAISFCLQAQTRFFATRSFIKECRVQNAEMVGVERDLRKHPGLAKNRHPYLN